MSYKLTLLLDGKPVWSETFRHLFFVALAIRTAHKRKFAVLVEAQKGGQDG